MLGGRLDDADETLRSTLELFPQSHYLVYLHLVMLYEAKGNFKEAAAAIEEVPVTVLESTMALGMRYLFMGLSGARDQARDEYEQLLATKRSGRRFIPASQLAQAALGASDYDDAAKWFTEAVVVECDPIMNLVAVIPFNRHLQHHAGFRVLVKEKMGLRFQSEKNNGCFAPRK